MLSGLWLATALALASGCVTVPAKEAGYNAGSTNSALNPNGTSLSRFWKRQSDKLTASNKRPAPNRINTDPPNAEFYLTMAVAQEQAGNEARADEFYQKAMSSDSKSLATLTGYAHFEDRRRHLVAATKLYKRAISRFPEEASIYNDLALCYQRRGMLDESISTLRKATMLQPEKQLYRNNLAIVLVDAERTDEALTQLLAANPPGVAHYNLACLLHRKGNDALATDHFQQALVHDPTLQAAEQWLAKIGSPVAPDAPEQRVAKRGGKPKSTQVDAGPAADGSVNRVASSDEPVTAPPASPPASQPSTSSAPATPTPAPQTVAQQAQPVSRPAARQKLNTAPVDELVAPPASIRVVPATAPPTDQPVAASDLPVDTSARAATLPVVEQSPSGTAAVEQLPREMEAVQPQPSAPVAVEPPREQQTVVEPLPTESVASEQPEDEAEAVETLPSESEPVKRLPSAPIDAAEPLADIPEEEAAVGTESSEALYSPPPTTEFVSESNEADDSLFSPPESDSAPEADETPGAEPLPAAEPLQAAEPISPARPVANPMRSPASSQVQYPNRSGRNNPPNGFETPPTAPLPDASSRPYRPVSQPNELEALPVY